MPKRKRSPAYARRVESFERRHGGLSPYQWRKRQLAGVGLTPYQMRQAGHERAMIGPIRREYNERLERVKTGVLTIEQMDAANRAWSRNKPERVQAIPGDGSDFSVTINPTLPQSRRGMAVLANQYHEGLANDPKYVQAFYHAITSPYTGYMSNHELQADGTIRPRYTGKKKNNQVVGNSYFKAYATEFAESVFHVDQQLMEEWFDVRYSMALEGML